MQSNNKKKAHRDIISLWALSMIFIVVSNLDFSNKKESEPFPSPDPNKGQAWGYDFNKKEYRYASKANPEDYPAKASKSKGYQSRYNSNLKIYRLEDIKDIHDLDAYIKQNTRVVYVERPMDEDQARDVLDYIGD